MAMGQAGCLRLAARHMLLDMAVPCTSDLPACLPACAPHLVKLEAHECLDESALAARLLPHDQHSRSVERLLEVL